MSDFNFLVWTQIAWIIAGLVWSVRRRDELPFVIAGFLFYVFGFRFWVLINGLAPPVDISPLGFEIISYGTGIQSLGLATLGESVLLGVYMWVQRASLLNQSPSLSEVQGASLRRWLWVLVAGGFPLVFVTRGFIEAKADSGMVVAFEVSNYAYLFPLMLSGVAILTAALLKAGQMAGVWLKLAAVGLLLVIAWLTFAPSLRFQFLGWLLAATFIMMTGLSLIQRLGILVTGLLIAIAFFTVAGALRNEEVQETGLRTEAFERFAFAEDANMLDGFALLMQVYPERLPYSLGGEHLEILMRPIPRALWPNKPVGGYINKLGLVTADSGSTIGISPSLIGTFYQEGGVIGMVVFAAIYGAAFGRLVRYSATIHPFAGALIRGVICAWFIPLLRGGDLPGIYAWFGMSFWPCVLILWLHRKEWFVRHAVPGMRSDKPRHRSIRRPVRRVEFKPDAGIQVTEGSR